MSADHFNLGEHVGAILAVMNFSLIVAGGLFWHMFRRMEKKIDEWNAIHQSCREHQVKTFVNKDDLEEWKKGRESLWRRINKHSHRPNGKVVIEE